MTPYHRVWPGLRREFLVNGLVGSSLTPISARARILRAYGMDVDPDARIEAHVRFGSQLVSIGHDTYVNEGVVFDNRHEWVRISPECDIGHQVLFVTTTHRMAGPTRRAGGVEPAAITVETGTWIGARAVILPGVTIGAGCVIAAGAVVVRNCEPHGLYAGVPASRTRDLRS